MSESCPNIILSYRPPEPIDTVLTIREHHYVTIKFALYSTIRFNFTINIIWILVMYAQNEYSNILWVMQ